MVSREGGRRGSERAHTQWKRRGEANTHARKGGGEVNALTRKGGGEGINHTRKGEEEEGVVSTQARERWRETNTRKEEEGEKQTHAQGGVKHAQGGGKQTHEHTHKEGGGGTHVRRDERRDTRKEG